MRISVLLLLLFPVSLFAQGKFVINGKVKGLPTGRIVTVTDVNKPADTIAQVISRNGTFKLEGSFTEPMLVNIGFGQPEMVMTFLKNDRMRLTGDTAKLKNLKLTGSTTHNDFRAFQKKFEPLFGRLMELNKRVMTGDRSDSLVAQMNRSKDTIENEIDAFIKKRSNSPVSAFLLAATYQLTDDILRTEQRYLHLKESAIKNLYGNYVRDVVADNKLTAVGAIAQDFTQPDTSGTPVALSSFRGKYVLLDFWASWCGPCRQENPNVVANYQKFNSKNFTVLGVSLDRPGQKARWIQAIHDDNLTWTHLSDLQFWSNAAAQQYKVQSIPQNFLIGPDGKIVAKNLRGPALEAKLCELLECN